MARPQCSCRGGGGGAHTGLRCTKRRGTDADEDAAAETGLGRGLGQGVGWVFGRREYGLRSREHAIHE